MKHVGPPGDHRKSKSAHGDMDYKDLRLPSKACKPLDVIIIAHRSPADGALATLSSDQRYFVAVFVESQPRLGIIKFEQAQHVKCVATWDGRIFAQASSGGRQ